MGTTFDFSPLFRSSIGFDRVFNLLENSARAEQFGNWPPYDIARTGEDGYRITMALAGFAENELTITHEPNLLTVVGEKNDEEGREFLYHGIAGRAFRRRFELADHVKVVGASLVNGLLTIDLERELPEEMKPRRIAINAGPALPKAGLRRIGVEKQVA